MPAARSSNLGTTMVDEASSIWKNSSMKLVYTSSRTYGLPGALNAKKRRTRGWGQPHVSGEHAVLTTLPENALIVAVVLLVTEGHVSNVRISTELRGVEFIDRGGIEETDAVDTAATEVRFEELPMLTPVVVNDPAGAKRT